MPVEASDVVVKVTDVARPIPDDGPIPLEGRDSAWLVFEGGAVVRVFRFPDGSGKAVGSTPFGHKFPKGMPVGWLPTTIDLAKFPEPVKLAPPPPPPTWRDIASMVWKKVWPW